MENLKKIEKRRAKEQKQLKKLKAQAEIQDSPHASILMIISLIVFNMFDLMATDLQSGLEEAITMFFAKLGSNAEVWVKFDMFGQVVSSGADYNTYQSMNGKLVLGTTIGFALLAVSPFYKALADKYGRRPFFIINCIGLMVATFVGFLSNVVFANAPAPAIETLGIVMYILAQVMIVFFTIQDIQMLYVFECVEDSKRATVFGITKGMGFVAYTMVIGSRLLSISGSSSVNWEYIFLGVGIFGAFALIMAVFVLRESKPFVKQRITYLEKTEAERKAELENKSKEKQTFLGALKTVFRNPQLRWLAIATLLVSVANNMICSRANSIMVQNGMSVLYITVALLSATVIKALANMIMGKLSDVYGRKPVVVVLTVLTVVSMTLFCFVTNKITDMSGTTWATPATLNAILTGAMIGLAFSCYLCIFDQITLIMSESTPTYIRSSVIGCMSAFRITAVVALILQSVLLVTLHVPTAWICYILSIPFVIATCVVIMIKTKETKGISIDDIDRELEEKAKAKV